MKIKLALFLYFFCINPVNPFWCSKEEDPFRNTDSPKQIEMMEMPLLRNENNKNDDPRKTARKMDNDIDPKGCLYCLRRFFRN